MSVNTANNGTAPRPCEESGAAATHEVTKRFFHIADIYGYSLVDTQGLQAA